MSLEPLIAAASIKLSISEDSALEELFMISEICGFSSFSKSIFIPQLTENEADAWLRLIEDGGYLSSEYYYYCNTQESGAVTSDLTIECDLCGLPIQDYPHDHEIMTKYKLEEEFVDTVRMQVMKAEESKYLNFSYINNLNALAEDIDDIIPFIGSGVSIPLGLPSWKHLLEIINDNCYSDETLEKEYKNLVASGDLLAAFDHLIDHSYEFSNYEQIKERIVRIMNSKRIDKTEFKAHNYGDLVLLNSRFYITTNYDLLMSDFLSSENDAYTSPICLSEISNIRNLMQGKNQVIHLHGHVNNLESMIVSHKDYQELYANQSLLIKFGSIMNNKPLLFIGFSFTDKFFEDLYQKMTSIVSSIHYIIIPNANLATVKKFSAKNIKVVSINVEINEHGWLNDKDYVKAIRVLIRYLIKDY